MNFTCTERCYSFLNAVHTIRTCKPLQPTVFKTAPSPPGHTAYKVVTIFLKLETVRLFHCFPKQEELLLSQQSYFLEFSLLNSNYWSHPSATRAECRIRTYKPNKRPRISSPLQYHYGNSADRIRRFMTAPILSMIFQIRFSDQSSRFSNSFVGFAQIYSVYTGEVFLGTSCLVGIA